MQIEQARTILAEHGYKLAFKEKKCAKRTYTYIVVEGLYGTYALMSLSRFPHPGEQVFRNLFGSIATMEKGTQDANIPTLGART